MRLLQSPLARVVAVAALLGATAWFAGRQLAEGASSVDSATLAGHTPSLMLALVAFALATLLLGAAWIVLVEDVATRRGTRFPLMLAFVYAWLVRYVPGGVPFFAGKVYLGQRAGYPMRQLVLATGVQNMLEVLVGAIVGATCIAIALGVTFGGGADVALGLMPAAGLFALHPSILRPIADRALRAFGRDPLPDGALPSVRAIVAAAALTAANQALNGIAMLIVLTTLTPAGTNDVFLSIGALSLAGVAGILVVIAPAGLGVRDGALTGLLAARFAVDAAALASVLLRAIMILSDVTLVLLAVALDLATGRGVLRGAFHGLRAVPAEQPAPPSIVTAQRRSA